MRRDCNRGPSFCCPLRLLDYERRAYACVRGSLTLAVAVSCVPLNPSATPGTKAVLAESVGQVECFRERSRTQSRFKSLRENLAVKLLVHLAPSSLGCSREERLV